MVVPDPSLQSLLDRVAAHGARITTDGRSLRIREWGGPLPPALAGELQLRQREVYRYLMGINQGEGRR